MFNLNIPDASSYLGIDGAGGGGLCSTPRTPELLNTLFAMTNPLDNITFTANTTQDPVNFNIDSKHLSQNSNHSSGCGSPLNSPANATTPTLNQTKSQLIKAGLKISIQSKRKRPTSSTSQTCDSSSGSEMPVSKKSKKEDESSDEDDDDDEEEEMYETSSSQSKKTVGLTAEDEDRRRRRRERNKIAATKCRLKKREKTNNLIKESEQLDAQNIDLKSQVKTLELERRSLLEMLQQHASVCTNGFTLAPHLYQSPAFKYFNILDLNPPPSDQQSQEPRKVIPSMETFKYSRQRQQHQQQQQQQQSSMTLPLNGYLKEEPQSTRQPIYDFESCSSSSDGHNDLIKHELVDSQSPYTTAQSAERFLFESNDTNLEMKHQINNNSNMLNNNNTIDYQRNDHSNFSNSCNIISQSNSNSYDPLLSKTEFLTHDDTVAGLLEQCTSVSELVDLDTGFSTQFQQMTNEVFSFLFRFTVKYHATISKKIANMQIFVRGFDALEALEVNNNTSVAEIKSALSQRKNVNCEELTLYCQSAQLADDLFVECLPSAELDCEVGLLGGKVHGSLARAGKVKGQTPKVEKQEKKKKKTGRAKRRIQYNRRFVNIVQGFGRRRGPNANSS